MKTILLLLAPVCAIAATPVDAMRTTADALVNVYTECTTHVQKTGVWVCPKLDPAMKQYRAARAEVTVDGPAVRDIEERVRESQRLAYQSMILFRKK